MTSTASLSFGTNSGAFAVLVTPLPYPSAQHNKHTAGSHSFFFFFNSGVIRKLSFWKNYFKRFRGALIIAFSLKFSTNISVLHSTSQVFHHEPLR